MKSIKQYIEEAVKKFFDILRPTILGPVNLNPSNKSITFSTIQIPEDFNLQKLYFMNIEKTPQQLTSEEAEILNDILDTANKYIDKLQQDTTQRIKNRVVDHLLKVRVAKMKPDKDVISNIIQEELDKSVSHFIKIAEAEGTKSKNMGALMKLLRVAADAQIDDPVVFFITSKDNKVCDECKRLHLLPDGVTPRVWKLREIKFSYHKKGENTPSINGLHPHCRCSLAMLPPGYGFNADGSLRYVSWDYDEYKKQRGEQ